MTVTSSSVRSSSCTPVTVSVCSVSQFAGVNVRLSGSTVAMVVSPLLTVTVTVPLGALESLTV